MNEIKYSYNESEKISEEEFSIKKLKLPRRFLRKKTFCIGIYVICILIIIQFLSNEITSSVFNPNQNKSYNKMQNKQCNSSELENEPIDVVYTWVNGSESKFQRDIRFFLNIENMEHLHKGSYIPARFNDKGELKYSLRSLEKHMPWIRHVYIVTNGQIPNWLNLDYEKVTIVTHKEIFPGREYLPTFSSPAIEANLHRIPGLSQKFIYFNDDIFLNADVSVEDFYTHCKGYKVYLAWNTANCAKKCSWKSLNNSVCNVECYTEECNWDYHDCDDIAKLTTKTEVNKTLENMKKSDLYSDSLLFTHKLISEKFGFKDRKVIAHVPLMIDKRIMAKIEEEFAEEFEDTRMHKFRYKQMLQLSMLYVHYLISKSEEKSKQQEIFNETLLEGELIENILLKNVSTKFQKVLINCSDERILREISHQQNGSVIYENYNSSNQDIIIEQMKANCERFNLQQLQRPTYKYETGNTVNDVSFNMITSKPDISKKMLNKILKFRKKFVCINDDLERSSKTEVNNKLVLSLLEDMYQTLFPWPSKFEIQ